jgi:hypothetical protein
LLEKSSSALSPSALAHGHAPSLRAQLSKKPATYVKASEQLDPSQKRGISTAKFGSPMTNSSGPTTKTSTASTLRSASQSAEK